MLIVLGGLPGSGKTTLARALAARLSACWLRIDTIEQSLIQDGICAADAVGPAGYFLAYRLARDNLQQGLTVIADSVNPLPVTRLAWQTVARECGVPLTQIEVICGDPWIHRQRVETRTADIAGHRLPSWDAVCRREYHPWSGTDAVIDTAVLSAGQAADQLLPLLARIREQHQPPR